MINHRDAIAQCNLVLFRCSHPAGDVSENSAGALLDIKSKAGEVNVAIPTGPGLDVEPVRGVIAHWAGRSLAAERFAPDYRRRAR